MPDQDVTRLPRNRYIDDVRRWQTEKLKTGGKLTNIIKQCKQYTEKFLILILVILLGTLYLSALLWKSSTEEMDHVTQLSNQEESSTNSLSFNFGIFCSFVSFLQTFLVIICSFLFLVKMYNKDIEATYDLSITSIIISLVINGLLLFTLEFVLFLKYLVITLLNIFIFIRLRKMVHKKLKTFDRDARLVFLASTVVQILLLLTLLWLRVQNFTLTEASYNSILIALSLPLMSCLIQVMEVAKPTEGRHNTIMRILIHAETMSVYCANIAVFFSAWDFTVMVCIGVFVLLPMFPKEERLFWKIMFHILVYFYGTSCVIHPKTLTVLGTAMLLLAIIFSAMISAYFRSEATSEDTLIVHICFVCHLFIFLYVLSFQHPYFLFIAISLRIGRMLLDLWGCIELLKTKSSSELRDDILTFFLPVATAFDVTLFAYVVYGFISDLTLVVSLCYLLTHLAVTATVWLSIGYFITFSFGAKYWKIFKATSTPCEKK